MTAGPGHYAHPVTSDRPQPTREQRDLLWAYQQSNRDADRLTDVLHYCFPSSNPGTSGIVPQDVLERLAPVLDQAALWRHQQQVLADMQREQAYATRSHLRPTISAGLPELGKH